MTAEAVLLDLSGRGIKSIPDGDALLVQPASRITESDRSAIRAAKSELLKLLAAPSFKDRDEDEYDRLARADGWTPPAEIPPAVAREIRRIEAEALRLGWSRQRLWRFEFWPHAKGEPRGLASVMNDDDAIVAVSKDYIAIGSRGRNFKDYRRFWRLDG